MTKDDTGATMISLETDQSHRVVDPNRIDDTAVYNKTTFPEVFAHHVANHPNKAAIVTATSTVTYAELSDQADRVAAALLGCAGRKAQPIALLFGQEIAAFAATVGVLKSGKFYVALDPLYPPARVTEILADSGAAFLLTSNSYVALAHQICPPEVKVINVDALPSALCPLPPLPIAADAYAYIGYTSGSTGKAKGVIETHRNHLCHWQNLMQAQPTYGNERVLFLNRLSFSGGQLAFYMTFLAGATLYLYDLQEHGIAQLSSWIQQHEITVWNSVPTVFRAFAAQISAPEEVASIRLLRLASDTILAQDIDAYRRLFAPTCKLWFCYALTEAKTVTMAFLDRNVPISPTEIPSGSPIDGMEIRIVDENGQLLGPNQVGEVVVRSRYVSPGYWGNAELTAARFQPDPDEVGTFLLQTGDLGKVDEQGCLFHKGRKDTQVKLRGYRVELSEIEAHLAALDGVQEVAVRIHSVADDSAADSSAADGDARLAAYLVCGSNPPPSGSQLRRLLGARLPAYMLPNSFTFLERMPVNRNGKIDRAALPVPEPGRPPLDTPLIAARTPLEETLTTIWQEVLGVEPIGIHDNFFDVGGHSLVAVTLFERIAKATGKSLPLSVVLQASTIAQQADLLCQPTTQAQWSSLVAVRAKGTRPPLFLVPPADGTALSFIKLVHYFDPEQPIYAFNPVGLNGREKPLTTIQAIAAHYVNEMRAFQPEGAYRLGGNCMGGHVAFEMARQLLAQGSEIEALVILDSAAPYNGPHWAWPQPQHSVRHYWRQLHKRMATRTVRVALQEKWHLAKTALVKQKPIEILSKTHQRAQMRYTAVPIPQHIFLVQSAEYASKSENQSRWSALALQGLTVRVVEGATHQSILGGNENHISQLARYLQDYLTELHQQQTAHIHERPLDYPVPKATEVYATEYA